MLFMIVQTILLVAIAFIAGCICGCWFKRMSDKGKRIEEAPSKTTAALAATTQSAVSGGDAGSAGEGAQAASAKPAATVSEGKPAAGKAGAGAAKSTAGKTRKAGGAKAIVSPAAGETATSPAQKAAKAPVAKTAAGKAGAKKAAVGKSGTLRATKSAAASPAAPAENDLKLIRGIGRQNEVRLKAAGITSFAQIAAWSKKEQAEMGEKLAFPGRIEREDWVAQAKVLAKGETTDFAKRVKKGEVASSSSKAAARKGRSGKT